MALGQPESKNLHVRDNKYIYAQVYLKHDFQDHVCAILLVFLVFENGVRQDVC